MAGFVSATVGFSAPIALTAMAFGKYFQGVFGLGSPVALSFAVVVNANGPDRRVVEAVKNANKTSIIALLKQRVDVNVPEGDGTTALHWAAGSDDSEIVELLIRAGANVKAANRYGVTPLWLACLNGNAATIERR